MKIRLSLDAIQDRRRIIAFLARYNPHAARRASRTLIDAIAQLSQNPFIGLGVDGMRELYIQFGDSGYVVQYRVDADVVVIARIFHMREAR